MTLQGSLPEHVVVVADLLEFPYQSDEPPPPPVPIALAIADSLSNCTAAIATAFISCIGSRGRYYRGMADGPMASRSDVDVMAATAAQHPPRRAVTALWLLLLLLLLLGVVSVLVWLLLDASGAEAAPDPASMSRRIAIDGATWASAGI